MYKITDADFKRVYTPYDIVLTDEGGVAFITEVSINTGQKTFEHQVSYSVVWLHLPSDCRKTHLAWWDHDELTRAGNLFQKIAETSLGAHSTNEKWVGELFERGIAQ